jgi:hypothetical protein
VPSFSDRSDLFATNFFLSLVQNSSEYTFTRKTKPAFMNFLRIWHINLGYGFDSKNVDCTNFPGVNRLMIKQTAEEATRICEHIYTAKKKEEVKDRHKWSYFALKVALCLCLVGFCILMIPVYTTGKERSDIIYIGLLTFMLSILLTTGIVVRTVCMKRDSTSLEESILKELKTYVDKENSTVYSRLNCQLYIGYKFFWLELRKIES